MIEQKCTGCGEPKPDDGMRLCVTCSRLVDDVFDEIGFDPESVIADSIQDKNAEWVRVRSEGYESGLLRAAEVVDACNREGPYNAIGAAARIREIASAGDAPPSSVRYCPPRELLDNLIRGVPYDEVAWDSPEYRWMKAVGELLAKLRGSLPPSDTPSATRRTFSAPEADLLTDHYFASIIDSQHAGCQDKIREAVQWVFAELRRSDSGKANK